eukprot:4300143-Pyramimonas_sp.AAC.1
MAHWHVDPGVPSRDAAALFDCALLPSSHIFGSASDTEVREVAGTKQHHGEVGLEVEENDKEKKEQARRWRRRMAENCAMGNPLESMSEGLLKAAELAPTGTQRKSSGTPR